MRYADSNAQAWAQYYAQGGKDPTGAVYFVSVPGVKEPASPQPAPQPAAVTTNTVTTAANPDATSAQPPSRRQSLLYNPYGAPGTDGGQDPGEDLSLENPYDNYGLGGGKDQTPGAGGTTNLGYGASPYYGLTRDVTGMDIKG
jgi:signal transducing adaptor molecule